MKDRKVSDIMTTTVITARPDMRLTDAIKLLLRWHISGLPVVDSGGTLIGVLTEHDVLNFAFSGDAADTLVAEAMQKKVTTCKPETPVEEVANCFATHRIRRVPVVKGGKVIGIVSRRDILREMNRIYDRF
jgi:CBS domain-containing protein